MRFILLTTFGCYWLLLANFCYFFLLVFAPFCYCFAILATFCYLLLLLASVGYFWLLLAAVGYFCYFLLLLAILCYFLLLLAIFGYFWLLLATCWYFQLLLGTFIYFQLLLGTMYIVAFSNIHQFHGIITLVRMSSLASMSSWPGGLQAWITRTPARRETSLARSILWTDKRQKLWQDNCSCISNLLSLTFQWLHYICVMGRRHIQLRHFLNSRDILFATLKGKYI